MDIIDELRNHLALYYAEMQRCEEAKCYFALLHLLLAMPDVCASLESPHAGGSRYVDWCNAYMPGGGAIAGADWYQMRNALFHSGSGTPENRGKSHQTLYLNFSFVDPDLLTMAVHATVDTGSNILNVHVKAMAADVRQAIENWFGGLRFNPSKLGVVMQEVSRIVRVQPKAVSLQSPDGSIAEVLSLTASST